MQFSKVRGAQGRNGKEEEKLLNLIKKYNIVTQQQMIVHTMVCIHWQWHCCMFGSEAPVCHYVFAHCSRFVEISLVSVQFTIHRMTTNMLNCLRVFSYVNAAAFGHRCCCYFGYTDWLPGARSTSHFSPERTINICARALSSHPISYTWTCIDGIQNRWKFKKSQRWRRWQWRWRRWRRWQWQWEKSTPQIKQTLVLIPDWHCFHPFFDECVLTVSVCVSDCESVCVFLSVVTKMQTDSMKYLQLNIQIVSIDSREREREKDKESEREKERERAARCLAAWLQWMHGWRDGWINWIEMEIHWDGKR